MSWLLTLLKNLVAVLAQDATARLVQAARESLLPKPPAPEAPPPIGESGAREASAYLDGANGVKWKRHMDAENTRRADKAIADMDATLRGEPFEEEKPVDDESAGGKP